jgi:hypothetical protein
MGILDDIREAKLERIPGWEIAEFGLIGGPVLRKSHSTPVEWTMASVLWVTDSTT